MCVLDSEAATAWQFGKVKPAMRMRTDLIECDGRIAEGIKKHARPRKQFMRWRLDDGQIEVVDESMAEVLRHKTPCERVAMALSASHTLRLLLEGRIRTRHPEWDDEHVAREITQRIIGGAR
jgi:hypothetical protein